MALIPEQAELLQQQVNANKRRLLAKQHHVKHLRQLLAVGKQVLRQSFSQKSSRSSSVGYKAAHSMQSCFSNQRFPHIDRKKRKGSANSPTTATQEEWQLLGACSAAADR